MGIALRHLAGFLCLGLFLALAAGPFTGMTKKGAGMETKKVHLYTLGPSGSALNGSVKTVEIPVAGETPISWFKNARYTTAAVLFFLGLWFMRGVYRETPGISLNPRWVALLTDAILILFLAFGAYCVVDWLMVSRVAMVSHFPFERAAVAFIAMGYIPAAAIFSLFSARRFGQAVEIGDDGLRVHFRGKRRFLPWEAIKSFDARDAHTVTARGGLLVSQKLQTKWVVRTEDGPVNLAEPALRETKTEILCQLRRRAPQRLQEDITRLKEAW